MDLFPVLVGLLPWGVKDTANPYEPPLVELQHADCGAPVRLALTCSAGHMLDSAREVRPVPGPGAVLAAAR